MVIVAEPIDVQDPCPGRGHFRQEFGLFLKSFEMLILEQVVRHMVGRSSRFLRPFEATDDVQLVSQQQLCGEADDSCEANIDQPRKIVAGLLPHAPTHTRHPILDEKGVSRLMKEIDEATDVA